MYKYYTILYKGPEWLQILASTGVLEPISLRFQDTTVLKLLVYVCTYEKKPNFS